MWKVICRCNQLWLCFYSPTGQLLVKEDVSDWTIQDFINKFGGTFND